MDSALCPHSSCFRPHLVFLALLLETPPPQPIHTLPPQRFSETQIWAYHSPAITILHCSKDSKPSAIWPNLHYHTYLLLQPEFQLYLTEAPIHSLPCLSPPSFSWPAKSFSSFKDQPNWHLFLEDFLYSSRQLFAFSCKSMMILYWSAFCFASSPGWEFTEIQDHAVHVELPQTLPSPTQHYVWHAGDAQINSCSFWVTLLH